MRLMHLEALSTSFGFVFVITSFYAAYLVIRTYVKSKNII